MKRDSPAEQLFKELIIYRGRHADDQEEILHRADAEAVIGLYQLLLKKQKQFDIQLEEACESKQVNKDFVIRAIIPILKKFERILQTADENASVGDKEKLDEALGYEDSRGGRRVGYKRHKGSIDARFPRHDREYIATGEIMRRLNWTALGGSDIKHQRIRQLLAVIMNALLNDEEIHLDDQPEGITSPAREVFCLASQTAFGGGKQTYFADIHTIGWLRQKLRLVPMMDKKEYPGFEVVTDFNRRLGRTDFKEDNPELKQFLIKILNEGNPITAESGLIDPAKVIEWFRHKGGWGPYGNSGPVLYSKMDVLEPFVRKHLICGRTDKENDWLVGREILLDKLKIRGNSTAYFALNLILYDLWKNHHDDVVDRLNVFRQRGASRGFLGKLGIKGYFYMHPDAVGTLIDRETILKKVKEIEGHEHEIILKLKREAEAEKRIAGISAA